MIERISLNSLKFFYFCALYGSVTTAAKKLFVTQSAVSKQIKSLECTLNIKLFIRSGRKVVLTPQGKELYHCCEKVFIQLEDCLNKLVLPSHQNKPLVLSCEPTISMKWLIPRLVEFNALNKGFEIVLLTGGGQIDFAEKSIDLAIRRNDFEWDEHIYAKKLVDEYVALVAKENQQTSDDKRLLTALSRPNLWQNISQNKQWGRLIMDYKKQDLEHFYLCIEAALSGMGTAIASIYMIEKEINHGLLQYIFAPIADGSAYYLLSKGGFDEDGRKVIFAKWLKTEMVKSKEQMLALANAFAQK